MFITSRIASYKDKISSKNPCELGELITHMGKVIRSHSSYKGRFWYEYVEAIWMEWYKIYTIDNGNIGS